MSFKLPPLPWPADALEPVLSRRALELHHGKHHAAYVKKLNGLVEGKQYAQMPLEEVVRTSHGKPGERAIFNNAAQAWNHAFFWTCMRPKGGGEPGGELAARLRSSFGSVDEFRRAFIDKAVGRFGSGWVWLVLEGDKLAVVATGNAETPITGAQVPLLTCDVWEHAYYVDYQNRREEFVEAFVDRLADWSAAERRLGEAHAGHKAR